MTFSEDSLPEDLTEAELVRLRMQRRHRKHGLPQRKQPTPDTDDDDGDDSELSESDLLDPRHQAAQRQQRR